MDLELTIGIIGLVVSIVGIPLAFVLARKGRQRPELRYATDFDELLSPDEGVSREDLRVSYAGHRVDRVSRTVIALWGERGDTVRGADIVEGDRLRIGVADGDVVLQAQPLACSRRPCGFSVTVAPGGTEVEIDFDFMDPGDGLVVEVLHAGERRARLLGTLRGAVVSNRGEAALSASYLDLVAEQSRRKRWKSARVRIVDHVRELGLRRLLPTFGGVLIPMAVMLGTYYFQARSPEVVDPSAYKLDTLSGQAEFAEEVQAEGLPDREDLWVVLAMLAIVVAGIGLGIVLLYIQLTRLVIPRSIVAIRPGDGLDDAVHVRSAAAHGPPWPVGDVNLKRVSPGERVVHKQFGIGTVTGLTGAGNKTVASVEFEEYGVKRLLLKYASLWGVPNDSADAILSDD